jgi:hypothetical protein
MALKGTGHRRAPFRKKMQGVKSLTPTNFVCMMSLLARSVLNSQHAKPTTIFVCVATTVHCACCAFHVLSLSVWQFVGAWYLGTHLLIH